jgi:hypothetical protein
MRHSVPRPVFASFARFVHPSAIAICAAAFIAGLPACSKSNPLIGKWKLTPASDSNPACAAFDGVEFSDTSMTINLLSKQTFNVTYSRNGDDYVVSGTPTGAISFETESGGIKSVSPECHLIPTS